MADSDSSIAWHRAQLKRFYQDLQDYESGRSKIGEMRGSERVDQTPEAIADLKRKIAQTEKLMAAYEKRDAAST